jgi:hypothetical protein
MVDKWAKLQERYYTQLYKILNTHINNISNDLVVAVGLNWSFVEEIDVIEDMALVCSSKPAFHK